MVGMKWVLSMLVDVLVVKNDAATSEDAAATSDGESVGKSFEMPLHYPRYKKADYEKMEEWRVDFLLKQYGLHRYFNGHSLDEKRSLAISTFLWPDQLP